MGVVGEDRAWLVDPPLEMEVTAVQPRGDCRERTQILELDEDVLLDRRRQERFPFEAAIVFGRDLAGPLCMA
jgi:hypothetical protein